MTEKDVNRLLAEHIDVVVRDKSGQLFGVWGDVQEDREWDPLHDVEALSVVLISVPSVRKATLDNDDGCQITWTSDQQADLALHCLNALMQQSTNQPREL